MSGRKIKKGEIRAVIFDLDGTLIDAYPAIIDSFNYTMKMVGAARQDERTIRRAVGWGLKLLLKPYVQKKDFKKAVWHYRRHHTEVLKRKTRLYPGAKMLLARLKKKDFKLAVASNRPTYYSRLILSHLGIKEYFDYILCGDKLKKAKPHPAILVQILKRFSLKPFQALYVGDMMIDIITGKKAKVRTVAVTTGSNNRAELKKLGPYKVIANISDLTRIFAIN